MDMNTIALIKGLAGNGGGGSSGGGVLVVHVDMQTRTLDKTYKEIADAGFAVIPFPANQVVDGYKLWFLIGYYQVSSDKFQVEFWNNDFGKSHFETDSENGYPVSAD